MGIVNCEKCDRLIDLDTTDAVHDDKTDTYLCLDCDEGDKEPANISEMFQDDQNQGVMDAMGELAATIATSMAKYKADEQQLKDDKKLLDSMKTKLAEMMVANNCKNGHKFDNGCFVTPFVTTKINTKAGITPEQLHEWLKKVNLGSIVKPTVNYNTMQATLKEYMSLHHGSLPDAMFNVSSEQTMKFSGNGHIKFLESLGKEGV